MGGLPCVRRLGWSPQSLFTFTFACPQILVGLVPKAFVIVAFGLEELIEVRLAIDSPV